MTHRGFLAVSIKVLQPLHLKCRNPCWQGDTSSVIKDYSPEEELTLQSDANETGLGAALRQQGKPITYVSRALTQLKGIRPKRKKNA